MKISLAGILLVVVLVIATAAFYSKSHPVLAPQPGKALPVPNNAVIPTDTTPFCDANNLNGEVDIQGAAGNIYGNVTIKNNSQTPCQIPAVNFITAKFDPAVKNITAAHQGQPQADVFILAPNQAIYSQIHYPNGPQCSGPPKQITVTLSLKISPQNEVILHGLDGSKTFAIPHCINPTEITEIQIWPVSDKQSFPTDKPITP